MRYVVHTQVRENYGAHDWDGVGPCLMHWKCKGGHAYAVEADTPALAISHVTLTQGRFDNYYEEYTLYVQTYEEFQDEMKRRIELYPWMADEPSDLKEGGKAKS
jgi:hypothetical protein